MARPERVALQAGVGGWDANANDNFIAVFDKPYPIPLHSGDETDLEATYAAASYDKCWIYVDHTVDGWTIYESDGVAWAQKEFGGGGAGGGMLAPLAVAVTDEVTALEAATPAVTFRMPADFTLTEIRASLTEASSSGNVQVDVNVGGATILSTKLTIDATEETSVTAATPAVISDGSIDSDDEITIDIDSAGTGAKGLKLYFIGTYETVIPSYSTSEKAMGYDWRDGKPVYRKTVACTLPNNNTASTAHSISTIDEVVKAEGRYLDASSDWQMLPRSSHINNDNIQLAVDGTNIMLRSSGDHSGGSDCYVDVYYTKV